MMLIYITDCSYSSVNGQIKSINRGQLIGLVTSITKYVSLNQFFIKYKDIGLMVDLWHKSTGVSPEIKRPSMPWKIGQWCEDVGTML